jgi:hypothetical protein
LLGGKKKRIVLQAFHGYLSMFRVKENYKIIDISPFEKKYIKLAILTERLGLRSLARYLYKHSCRLIYRRQKE